MDIKEQTLAPHRIKSILKPRSKPSANALRVKTSNTSSVGSDGSGRRRRRSSDARKKVEITTPDHSDTSIQQDRPARSSMRETPLPRVAMLPPRPGNLEKYKPKPKTFFAKKESSLKKKSGAPTPRSTSPRPGQNPVKTSASTSRIKAKPVTSSQSQVGGRSPASPKRSSKSGKKLKKKKKSKSTTDVRSSEKENGGRQYIQELVTINELLKSVTDPSNRETHPGVPLIEGIVRPFSAMELSQLLTSVGKVATIHKDPTNLVPKPPGEDSDTGSKKIPAGELTEEEALAAALSETSSKKKKKKRKSKKSSKSRSITSTSSKTKKTKENPEPKPIPAKGSANKNLNSKKTLKSNVKTVTAKTKTSGGKKEELESELSELDLVKSALLNKRYYEESLALLTEPTKDELNDKKKKSKDLKRSKAAHSSAQSLARSMIARSQAQAPRNSGGQGQLFTANKVRHFSSPGPGGFVHGRSPGPLPLPTLKPTDKDGTYNKALGNVLINYSHVIRPPTRRGLEDVGTKPKLENGGAPEILDLGSNKANTPQFDKQLQNIKYGGPVERGILDIGHVKVSEEPPAPGKYTHLSASKFTSTVLGHEEEIAPASILVKDVNERDVASSDGTPKSRKSSRKSRKSRSRSRSPIKEAKVPKAPNTAPAPVVGFHFGPLASQEKKANNSTRGATTNKRASPLTRTGNPHPLRQNTRNSVLHPHREPPIVSLVKPRPTDRWNDQSITPSVFGNLPEYGKSRWAILNERVMERNRELKNDKDKNKKAETQRPKGAGRGPPHPVGGEGKGRSSKQRDPMEEKRTLLKNLDKAKKAFDEFGVQDNVMGRNFGKDQHAKIDEAFGLEKHRT